MKLFFWRKNPSNTTVVNNFGVGYPEFFDEPKELAEEPKEEKGFDDPMLHPLTPDEEAAIDVMGREAAQAILLNRLPDDLRNKLLAQRLGDEPYDYGYGLKAYLPHYQSVIAPHVFDTGGVLRLPWLLEQSDIWVDAWGHIHALDRMPQDYLLNVLILIHEHLGKGTVNFDPFTTPLVQRLRELILED